MSTDLLKSLQISATGLSAERLRLEVIAGNVANANSTRTPDGGPFKRRMTKIEAIPFEQLYEGEMAKIGDAQTRLPHIMNVIEDKTPGPLVYDPSHPDANPEGYLEMPNVNVTSELVDMMTASRAYEANLNVIDASKDMAMKALEIGRG